MTGKKSDFTMKVISKSLWLNFIGNMLSMIQRTKKLIRYRNVKLIFVHRIAYYKSIFNSNNLVCSFCSLYQIKEIRIPNEYTDSDTNYAYDIALLYVTIEIQFGRLVRPACIELNENNFEIPNGAKGKVGLTI